MNQEQDPIKRQNEYYNAQTSQGNMSAEEVQAIHERLKGIDEVEPAMRACVNTDRELWREKEGDFYADSIHVTKDGGIGINCGGHVYVKPLREWHRLAKPAPATDAEKDKASIERMYEERADRIAPITGEVLDRDDLVWKAWSLFKEKNPTIGDSARQLLFYNGWNYCYDAINASLAAERDWSPIAAENVKLTAQLQAKERELAHLSSSYHVKHLNYEKLKRDLAAAQAAMEQNGFIIAKSEQHAALAAAIAAAVQPYREALESSKRTLSHLLERHEAQSAKHAIERIDALLAQGGEAVSELTTCNHCNLNRMRRDARANKLRVTLIPTDPKQKYYMGGMEVYVHPRTIKRSELQKDSPYWKAWLMEIPDHCVC